MSTRFFASVRRNQKQWMVVLTVLSMVSFLFLDDFGRGKGPMSAFGGGLMIGCLCAAGMCIVGYPRQKTAEFGIGGFLVGFIAGFIGFGAVGPNKTVVHTTIGDLKRSDLDQLSRQRIKVSQFIFAVARKTQNPRLQPFGDADDTSLVTLRMLVEDAHKMGIRISDERVNEFLKQISQGRLSKQDFKDCLRDAHLGEGELFELLKIELAAQLAIELTRPPSYLPPIPPGFAQFMREPPEALAYMQQTPYQLWSSFQKLTAKESLQAVAIPVGSFTSKVGEPSDIELTDFFDKYKGRYWRDESRPGFLQQPRVQLAYLSADFEKFEKGPDPTDAEISEFYGKNISRYRVPMAKESTAPKLPDGEAGQTNPAAGDESQKPDDPTKQKSPEDKAPAPDSVEKKPVEGKTTDGDKKESKVNDKPKDDPKSNCGDGSTEKPAAEEKPPADEKPAGEKGAEGKAEPAGDKTNENAGAGDSATLPAPGPPPAEKYRELNDELKSEIRDEILRERAFEKIVIEVDKAHSFMVNLGLDYDSTSDAEKKKEKAITIAEQLKKYAEDHKLEYKELPELTYEELTSEPIGLAFEGKGRSPVVNDVFTPGPRGEPRIPLYSPRRADLKSEKGSFAYWKIAELPPKIGDLKDDAVRTKVVSAWKFDQARSIAEKRAVELVKKAKSEGNNLPAALAGESVTGDKNDPVVTVIPTDPFTWLSMNQSVPGASQEPAISRIPLIDNIDESFMKTVFEELGEGDIGVVSDEPRSVFYVVKVMNREASQNDDGGVAKQDREKEFMKEEFASRVFPLMKTPYQSLARIPQQQIDLGWRRIFDRNHELGWVADQPPARRRK